ncbi:unnamed protein product [Soboliphyme baturini]|uniref:PAX3 and PAX7 binding protein 1 n=1 Tax=Soboliphyme baturini TaxID=241478 RepID=A0A183IR56_9BILA|nr:unnamed protein product [Soboliphyme baturini]
MESCQKEERVCSGERMFKKRVVRNLRLKTASEESSDEEGSVAAQAGTSTKTATSSRDNGTSFSAAIKPSVSSSSLLSFPVEEEETGETFKLKKSRRRKHERRREKFLPLAPPVNDSEVDIEVTEVRIVHNQPEPVFSGVEAELFDDEVEPTDEIGKFREMLSSGVIPDAKMIHMARKRRQQARESGDFIPIDTTQKFQPDSSRLVREDENDASDSGEEGGKFYSRFRSQNEEERRQMEAAFLNAVEESDDERDAELARWEEEQMRKGVSVQQLSQYHHEQAVIESISESKSSSYVEYTTSVYYPPKTATQYYPPPLSQPPVREFKEPQPMDLDIDLPAEEASEKIADTSSGASASADDLPQKEVATSKPFSQTTNYSLNDVISKVSERVEAFEEVKRSFAAEAEQAHKAAEENRLTEAKLIDIKPELSIQHQFFQEMFSYITDLLDCLNEKVPVIRKIVEQMTSLMETRTRFFVTRRQQDVKDQYEECTIAGSGNLQLLQLNSERTMRAAEREARRSRRRQAREKLVDGSNHRDGMSSDDEEVPSRIVTYNAEKGTHAVVSLSATDVISRY